MALSAWLFVIGLIQLVWLIATWRKSGFLAALSLFIYGVLSMMFAILQSIKDGDMTI